MPRTMHDERLSQAQASADEGEELEVIKVILLREEYVARVRQCLHDHHSKFGRDHEALCHLIGLLDLLRSATIDAVEAIQRWRGQHGHRKPFIWDGANYLLKISVDLDFLDEHKVLRYWLSYSLRRNPFLVPVPLNELGNACGTAPSENGGDVSPMDSRGFTAVGGSQHPHIGLARRKDHLVKLNEPSVSLRGSIISDRDLKRIRKAAALLLQEENIYGRLVRDSSARLVPADVAKTRVYSQRLKLDDYQEIDVPARTEHRLAPFTEIAGIRRIDPNGIGADFAHISDDGAVRGAGKRTEVSKRGAAARLASGRASARCTSGQLRPVAVVTASPRKVRPARRSVGAALYAEMLNKKQQNQRLQEELESLRKELAEAHAQAMQMTPLPGTTVMDSDNDDNTSAGLNISRAPAAEELDPATCWGRSSLLQRESNALEHQARKYVVLEEQYNLLQKNQRDAQNKKRALVLERKRRLLEQDPNLQQRAEDDEYTLEDHAATQVQRIVRGWQGRFYVKRLRPILIGAAVAIQGLLRGHLGRSYASVRKKNNRAITNIQRVWRGHMGRATLHIHQVKKGEDKAAQNIQRIYRGRRDRVRAEHKRDFLSSAKRGAEVVGVRQLFHQDIVDLADTIDISIHNSRVPPPPSVVLGLLRVVALMLEEDDEAGRVTTYTTLGVQSVYKIGVSRQFTWVDALRVLRRSSKLLRRLRQVAEGPASKRPRMVHFSQAAVQTYKALRYDCAWNPVTLGRIGGGAKACQHILMWVDALQEVFAHQLEFGDDLGSDRAPWVGRVHASMRHMRHLEVSRLVWEHGVACLNRVLHESRSESVVDKKRTTSRSIAASRRGDLRVSVVERSLAIFRERETDARHALCVAKEQEEDTQKNDLARELFRMETLLEDLKLAELDVAEKSRRLEDAKKASFDGIEADQTCVQLCLDELTASEVARRERWTFLEMYKLQTTRNAKRRGVEVEVWGDLRHQLRVVAEAEAAAILAIEEHKYTLEKMGDVDARSGSSGSPEIELLRERAQKAEDLVRSTRLQLGQMEDERETAHAIATESELQREETVFSHMWDEPSEEEREEDINEDERCARLEAEVASRFVRPDMLRRPFERPRPVVVCLARDVPGEAKDRIVRQLDQDLPGLTVHINDTKNIGLDIDHLQDALSARFSVICEVDVGLGQKWRNVFFQRLTTTKEALIPTPSFILVVGVDKNRSGGPLDTSVGCTGRDLAIMGDGAMKRCLEDVGRVIKELQCPTLLEALANMGRDPSPPSPAHMIVVEAVTILLTPQNTFHKCTPLSSLKGVAWMEARQMLTSPTQLLAAIASVDIFDIPMTKTRTLKVYVDHDHWPKNGLNSAGDDDVLPYLAEWARAAVTFSELLNDAGGRPEALSRYSSGLLAAVVPVLDDHPSMQGHKDAEVKRGWRAAYHQILTALLEDVRVFRVARRVQGTHTAGVHLIEVYQECERLFFHVYSPESCVGSFCVVEERQVSQLLAPTLDQPPEFGSGTVPCDRENMFSRLVARLSFKVTSRRTANEKCLTCERPLRRLLRDVRHISGHLAKVTVYEEARGELRYMVYLADHTTRLQLKVDSRELERVLPDSSVETGEREALTSEDTRHLLVPVTDRLAISPSRVTISMGAKCARRRTTATLRSRGLVLKLRLKGGPGRRVFQTVSLISGASHILTVWELGRRGLLRVVAYDPTKSISYETLLSKTERVCLRYDRENCKSWCKDLTRRLSLRRANAAITSLIGYTASGQNPTPGKRTMSMDKTIFATTYRVTASGTDSRLLRVRASLTDAGNRVALDLYQNDTSKECRILLKAEELAPDGIPPPIASGEPVPASNVTRPAHTEEGISEGAGAEEGSLMGKIIADANSREGIMRRLLRTLRFPDPDTITLPTQGIARSYAMTPSNGAEQRRPQGSLRVTSESRVVLRSNGSSELNNDFLNRRRQPDTLVYERETARVAEEASRPINRGKPRGRKGKQKREKAGPTSVSGRAKMLAGTTMVADGDELQRKTEAVADRPVTSKGPEENEMDYIRSTTVATSISLPQFGERRVFIEAVPIRKDDWEAHQPVCDTIVTVYECPPPEVSSTTIEGNEEEIALRAVVYYPRMASYAEVPITGFIDLRQVVGPLQQPLAYAWRQQRTSDTADVLFNFIFRERAMIRAGTWDGTVDAYVEHGSDFSVILKRNRLYRSIKQTPIHLGREQDAQANSGQLIDDVLRRGRKIYRGAVNVSSTLFHLTAYEIPSSEETSPVPALKFIAYEPRTQLQLVAMIESAAVLEAAGGPHSPWIDAANREKLAGIVAGSLRLKALSDGSAALVMPWSREPLGSVDEVQLGETSRPRSEKMLACAKREGFSRVELFSTRITGHEVVVTVFVASNAAEDGTASVSREGDTEGPILRFNVYSPKLNESADVDLQHSMQKMMTGRNIFDFAKGEARSAAVRHVSRFLCVTLNCPPKGFQVKFENKYQKPWLVAYNELDASSRPQHQRPRGQPVIFVPAETEGDVILAKAISIGGLKVVLSVHTKDKGRPGKEGLVWQVYNQETCVTCTLHLSASGFLEQVDQKDHLCEDDRLLATIHMLTKRLVLRKTGTGAWELRLDRKLEPWLFGGL